MVSKAAAYSICMLRSLALIASLISMALAASNNFLLFNFLFHFEDIVTFRYVLAVGVISLLYGMVQLSIAVFHALKLKRFVPPPPSEFYADQVMSLLLATGSGAGIAVARNEFKKGFFGGGGGGSDDGGDDDSLFGDYNRTQPAAEAKPEASIYTYLKFFDKLLAASVFLLLAWLCLALISIISFHNNNNNNNNNNKTLSIPHHHHRQPETVLEVPSATEPAQHTHVDIPTHEDFRASSGGGVSM